MWVNLDADGLEDANDRPQNWYAALDLAQITLDSIGPNDTNVVAGSSSWLQGFLDGNRNWLITPPIFIADDQATLHWKSAPRQGPRYMDGYSVLISTSENIPESFTDTVLRVKQMIPPLPNGASDPTLNALNVDSFLYAPANGYFHADGYTLADYFYMEDSSANHFIGKLEPHSFSLADYAGQTIYVAFVHDSDDDNYITIDDILILGNLTTSVNELSDAEVRLVTYPNPADNFVNVLFRLEEPADVRLSLYDLQGRLVRQLPPLTKAVGEQSHRFDVRTLPSGTYEVVLDIEGQRFSRRVVRK